MQEEKKNAGAQNAVMGDQDLPMSMPVTQMPEAVLIEEKKMAKYSQSDEFKRLAKFMEDRIKFYQRYFPNGSLVEGDPKDPHLKITMPQGLTPEMVNVYWMAACLVTKEFQGVLDSYERAREAVNDARSENT